VPRCERAEEEAELARVGRDVVDAHAADDVPVARGDRDLARADELRHLGRCRARGPVAPEAPLGFGVDDVDEGGDLVDEPRVVGGGRVEQRDVHPSRMPRSPRDAMPNRHRCDQLRR
jgi:hypothetical protein